MKRWLEVWFRLVHKNILFGKPTEPVHIINTNYNDKIGPVKRGNVYVWK